MDVDDPVVSEIPVYLCSELSKQLHVFQFPCQSSDSANYTENVVSSRVKPQNGIIELDCALDTKSPHYDFYVGEELASDTSDKSKSHDSDDETKLFDKLTLRSQRSILKKDINCYSIAGVYDGKFCISPLEDAHSFLPSHEHKEKLKNSNVKDIHAGSDVSDDDMDGADSVTPITVKFTHKNTEKTKTSQERIHQQHLMKTAEEPWCETTFYHSKSSIAIKKSEGLTKVVPQKQKQNGTILPLTEEQYLNILIPEDTDDLNYTNSK